MLAVCGQVRSLAMPVRMVRFVADAMEMKVHVADEYRSTQCAYAMCMGMFVANRQRVKDYQTGTADHNGKRDGIIFRKWFPEHDKGNKCSDKGGKGVEGACFCRTDDTLRLDVKVDAQSVGNKADRKSVV